MEVKEPLATLGRRNLDFGQGFYVTDMRWQAERWAKRKGARTLKAPVVSVYDFDVDGARAAFRTLKFDAYDKRWLDFIAASRKGHEPWKGYDMIEGGVANDNVIDTVEDYLNGRMSAEAALGELARHQPNNQICLLRQEVIDRYLFFLESFEM